MCIHVGPFIRCRRTEIEVHERTGGCPECYKPIPSAFCPVCGHATDWIEVTRSGWNATASEREGAFLSAGLREDGLVLVENPQTPREEQWFLGNNHGGPGIHIDQKSGVAFLGPVNPQADVSRMAERYGNYIDVLGRLYGVENVSVEWGVISW